eukprot:jgi/Tetstr1/431706/TSEL_021231.t1
MKEVEDYLKLTQRLRDAGVDVGVVEGAGVAAKVAFGSDELGQRTLDLLSSSLTAQTLESYAGKMSPFAEFCHDSENISPREAANAIVYQYNSRALVASVVNFVSCRVRDVHVDDYYITMKVYREKGRTGRRGPDDLRVLVFPVSEHPHIARLLHHFIDHVHSAPMVPVALAETNFKAVTPSEQSKSWTDATKSDWLSTTVRLVGAASPAGTSWSSHNLRKGTTSAANAIGAPLSHIRYQGGWGTTSGVVLDYIDPNVLPSPGAWFFFGHIAPLRHFEVQQHSAAVAFPVPPS